MKKEIDKFDGPDTPTVHAEAEQLLQRMGDLASNGLKQAKALTMEFLLMLQFMRLQKDNDDANVANFKALLTKFNIFLASSPWGVQVSDIHPTLWSKAQEFSS